MVTLKFCPKELMTGVHARQLQSAHAHQQRQCGIQPAGHAQHQFLRMRVAQAAGEAVRLDGEQFFGALGKMVGVVGDEGRRVDEAAQRKRAQGLGAVSYTHLDVYKRQLCARETEIFRLGERVAFLARAEVGGCLLCAATDAPAALRVEIVSPPELC